MDSYIKNRLKTVYSAFAIDGFRAQTAFAMPDALGVLAVHKTAKDYDTRRGKTSYYLEGTPYMRGYLLGMLAEPQISEMAIQFNDNILLDFVSADFFNHFPMLQKWMVALLYELCDDAYAALPVHIHEEVDGLLAGCKKVNPRTGATKKRLIVMNVGFDALCALVYTGAFLRERKIKLPPDAVRLTMMCNAFSVFGPEAGGGHYFARDFMFASGGVFQRNIAHIIHIPKGEAGETLHPYLSVTAPGIVGSISAMNARGTAVSINMSPAANCDPERLGMNSLLLARECIMRGGSAQEAVRVIRSTGRGVTWNYALSDGENDVACTVEAGASWTMLNPLQYPPESWRPYLPDAAYLEANTPEPPVRGMMTRWCGAEFPEAFYTFNPGLWGRYQQTVNQGIRLLPGAFMPQGFINRTPAEKNCPSGYYFAPQRTQRNVHITTNHFLMPQMRLCAMDAWTLLIAGGQINDIQWRYDALNDQINRALTEYGSIDYERARKIADFLAPYGEHSTYYAKNPKSVDGSRLRIEGCVSLFDLKAKTAESHYGYYGDPWVRTTLMNYINESVIPVSKSEHSM